MEPRFSTKKPMKENNQRSAAKAGFKSDLFSQTAIPNALPTDIQFMPPGVQNICPFVDGEPFRMTIQVNEDLADKLNAQLQLMRQKSSAGKGDVPFIDFNHEDAEASGEVLELYWGGLDMVKGGIRMKINWTSAGVVALQGKMYRRFSPQWLLDTKTKEPVGIGVNLGGLVNRAAFQNIQPVVAKSALSGAAAAVSVTAKPVGSQPNVFFKLVTARQEDKRISFDQALAEIQRENPGAAEAYAKAFRGSSIALPIENHPLIVEADAIAKAKGINAGDAQVQLARANFPLYQKYLASLQQNGQKIVIAKAGNSGQQRFLREVQAKQSGGMSFDAAVNAVCFSRPDLLEEYRGSFRSIKTAF